MSHEVRIEEIHILAGDGHVNSRYWWACSCGKAGNQKSARWQAESGGKVHVKKAIL